MPIICWTEFYPGSPSLPQHATRLANAAGRRVRPVVHHANLVQHHVANVTAAPHRLFRLVCKVVPAAVVGGGAFLALHPPIPASQPAPPPAIAVPGPAVWPGLPPSQSLWPLPPSTPSIQPSPPVVSFRTPPTSAPEPSSGAIMLGGVAGLLVLRLSLQRLAYSSDRVQPNVCQAKLLGSSPVA